PLPAAPRAARTRPQRAEPAALPLRSEVLNKVALGGNTGRNVPAFLQRRGRPERARATPRRTDGSRACGRPPPWIALLPGRSSPVSRALPYGSSHPRCRRVVAPEGTVS